MSDRDSKKKNYYESVEALKNHHQKLFNNKNTYDFITLQTIDNTIYNIREHFRIKYPCYSFSKIIKYHNEKIKTLFHPKNIINLITNISITYNVILKSKNSDNITYSLFLGHGNTEIKHLYKNIELNYTNNIKIIVNKLKNISYEEDCIKLYQTLFEHSNVTVHEITHIILIFDTFIEKKQLLLTPVFKSLIKHYLNF